jgi:hypothetical protein
MTLTDKHNSDEEYYVIIRRFYCTAGGKTLTSWWILTRWSSDLRSYRIFYLRYSGLLMLSHYQSEYRTPHPSRVMRLVGINSAFCPRETVGMEASCRERMLWRSELIRRVLWNAMLSFLADIIIIVVGNTSNAMWWCLVQIVVGFGDWMRWTGRLVAVVFLGLGEWTWWSSLPPSWMGSNGALELRHFLANREMKIHWGRNGRRIVVGWFEYFLVKMLFARRIPHHVIFGPYPQSIGTKTQQQIHKPRLQFKPWNRESVCGLVRVRISCLCSRHRVSFVHFS